MNKKISLGAGISLMLIIVAVSISITAMVMSRKFSANVNDLERRAAMYDKLEAVDSKIRQEYYGDIDPNILMDKIAQGYISGIGDPYATYYTAEEYNNLMNQTGGKVAGIGISAEMEPSGYMRVLDVYPDSPAESSGIAKNNLIVRVDDLEVNADTYAQALEAIKGKAGTKMTLVVRDEDNTEEKTIDITRRVVVTPTVYTDVFDKTGYIRITGFNATTYDQFRKAVKKMTADGIGALVFDVRNNTGGTDEAIIKILDYLLPEGDIMSATYKNGETKVLAVSDADCVELPMAVIVNEKTASAAELFAQALKDYNKAKIVGTKTFGKGSMQKTFQLQDGAAITYTIAKYNPPKSGNFEGIGVKPDYEVNLTEEQKAMFNSLDETNDPQLQKALEYVNTEMSKLSNVEAEQAPK
ncbi:MAG: S41 family peptidase [Oscillospiraceae bacterium]